jgi:Fe-Mn family superoxide dismutase
MEHQLPQLPFAIDALAPHMSQGNPRIPLRQAPSGLRHQPEQPDQGDRIRSTRPRSDRQEGTGRRHLQQLGAGVEPHFLLELPDTQRWRRAAGALAAAIDAKWGSFAEFAKAFQASAVGNFGSGWTWLVKKADGSWTSSTWVPPARR